MKQLRVVTINTAKGDGPYYQRLQWMAEELRLLDPDIVACQEVFASEAAKADTACFLAQSLGMQVAAVPARHKPREFAGREVMSSSGMAMLSRYPFERAVPLTLPSDVRDGERIAQLSSLMVAGRCVVVANVHLTHLRDGDDLRRRQLHTVLDALATAEPVTLRLLAGDFNTTAAGAVLAPVLNVGYRGMSVTDTWPGDAGRGEVSTLTGRAAPGRRVDMILAAADGRAEAPAFAPAGLVLNRPHPDSALFPSDHAGIVVTFDLPAFGGRR